MGEHRQNSEIGQLPDHAYLWYLISNTVPKAPLKKVPNLPLKGFQNAKPADPLS